MNNTSSFFGAGYKKAFTVVELIIVITVIGILAAISIVAFNGVQRDTRNKTLRSDVEKVKVDVIAYSLKNNGNYGPSIEWYSPAGPNPYISIVPNQGTIIDVVANQRSYCIRAYHPDATNNSISTALTSGSSAEACNLLPASVGAGGAGSSNLVAWWKLNGNALDSSGNDLNGSVNNGVSTTGANGVANSAYTFAASSTANNISLPAPATSTSLTIAAWIRPTAYPAERSTIIESMLVYGYYLSLYTDGSLQIYRYGTTPEGYHTTPASTIPLNQWSYVVGSWDGTNARLYINGTLRTAVAVTGAGVVSNQIVIGAESAARQFIGSIDDVRIYNTALSDATITSLYTAGAQ